jgi:hypothetical protein
MNYKIQPERVQNQLMFILECHDIMMMDALAAEFGYGKKRLKRALTESAKLVREYEKYYADEKYTDKCEEAKMYMRSAYFSAVSDLKNLSGVDIAKLEERLPLSLSPLKAYSNKKTGKPNPEAKERRKIVTYMDYIASVSEVMLLLYLHQDEGFGAERLEKLHRAIRQEWLKFALDFMDDKSAKLEKWRADKLSVLLEKGVDLEKLYTEISEELKE